MEDERVNLIDEENRELRQSATYEDQRLLPRTSFEDALSRTGYGYFQYRLLAICALALSSEAVEILSVSYAMPPAACELKMTDTENGYFTAVIFIGMMVGGLLWGNLADLLGRRSVLISSLTVNAVFGLCSSFAQTFIQFMVFRFLSGVGVGGSLPVIFSYYSEFQPKDRRGSKISLLASFWMSGSIFAAVLAWLVIPVTVPDTGNFKYTSWHIYLTLCAVPSLSAALLFLFMPESPKFLAENGKAEEAYHVLLKVFRANNRNKIESDYPVNQFYWIADRIDSSKRKRTPGANTEGTVPKLLYGILEMVASWAKLFQFTHLRTTLLFIGIFFTLAFGYYGLMMWLPRLFEKFELGQNNGTGVTVCGWNSNSELNSSSLEPKSCMPSKQVYLDGVITSLANLPGNILAVLLSDRVGRKPILAFSLLVAGGSVFFIWLISSSVHLLIMSCVFSGVTTVSFSILDIIPVEAYPTVLRSTANGLLQATSRIAAILGNVSFALLIEANCAIPLTVVASLLVIGAILSLFLPETKQSELK